MEGDTQKIKDMKDTIGNFHFYTVKELRYKSKIANYLRTYYISVHVNST
jgi:hypothetical protein